MKSSINRWFMLVLAVMLAIGLLSACADDSGVADTDGDTDTDQESGGTGCLLDLDCPSDSVCHQGNCIPSDQNPCSEGEECSRDTDCPVGEACGDDCTCSGTDGDVPDGDGGGDDDGTVDGDKPVGDCELGPEILAEQILDFGYVPYNTEVVRTVNISNLCEGRTLTVTSMEIVSTSTEFSLIQPPDFPAMITGIAESIQVDISYKPLDAGPDEAELVISSDDPDGPFRVQLRSQYKGTADIDANPNPLDFHNVVVGDPAAERTLILKNLPGGENDNAVLRINGLYLESESSEVFAVNASTLPLRIGQGQELEITVLCHPPQMGEFSDRLIVESNDIDESTYVVELSCTGVAPVLKVETLQAQNTLNFGEQRAGVPVTIELTLSNSGGGMLIVQPPEMVDTSSEAFSLDLTAFANGEIALEAGQHAALPVTFNTMTVGEHSGQIRIDNNTFGSQNFIVNLRGEAVPSSLLADPEALQFPETRVSQQVTRTLTLTNTGSLPVTLVTIGFAETSDVFSFDETDVLENVVLESEGTHELHVTFAPLARQNYSALIHIVTDDLVTVSQDIAVGGLGIAPVLVVTERDNPDFVDQIDFGEVGLNSTEERVLDLANQGDAVLTIQSLQITTNSTLEEFSFEDTGSIQIAAGGHVGVTLRYSPITYPGEDIGGFLITGDDPFSPQVAIGLFGIGTDQRLSVAPVSPLEFPDTHFAAQNVQRIRLRNSGILGVLVVDSLEVLPGFYSDVFVILPPEQGLPFELYPGEANTLAVDIAFLPVVPEGESSEEPFDFNATVQITSNSYLSTTSDYELAGRGVPCPEGWWDLDDDPSDCEYPCDISNYGVEICDDLDNDCNGETDDGANVTSNCTPPDYALAICPYGFCDFECLQGYHRCGEQCYPDDDPMHCGSGCLECQDDGNTCTFNVCEQGMCGHQIEENQCLIDHDCYEYRDSNPDNVCRICLPFFDPTSWSDIEDGALCDDGLFCTVDDACSAGDCTDTQPRDCSEAIVEPQCQVPDCDEEHDSCIALPANVGEGCDDGDPCTDNDRCGEDGACVGDPLEWIGQPCDGNDADLCEEGVFTCELGEQICTDISSDTPDLCNGEDDDCNPDTPDGTHESWLSTACDGTDTDLCEEGQYICQDGSQVCTDTSENNLDLCNGEDDDCNPLTADGSGESWLQTACDGTDTDLCEEGLYICQGGNQVCTDTTDNTRDICDGQDNDCNPDTPDGSDESWYGTDCDGEDSDNCKEGIYSCIDAQQSCSDNTGDNLELCDGVDNDCNVFTLDGRDEDWYGNECDGEDADLCAEGIFLCSESAQICSDNTTDNLEYCDGQDNDCNPNTADGADAVWLGDPCDGEDADLCEEGVFQCVNGDKTCDDTTSNNLELCNGEDDDCNPFTADGNDEEWLGNACDGEDTDLCEEGIFQCVDAAQSCSDTTGNLLDLCDGEDNDCNPATIDGQHEAWYDTPCDGPDSDLCNEGNFTCQDSVKTCNDASDDTPDLCNGQDDDCNPYTPDGADESWLGDACDGEDSDLCEEGFLRCVDGGQSCSDTTGANLELCDGLDNDCNPATADGADATWLGDACDGNDADLCQEGVYVCSGAAKTCNDESGDTPDLCNGQDDDCNPITPDGAHESWLGTACDGSDSDLCEEGFFQCVDGGQSCSDTSGENPELCDGLDNDCNPATADGADATWLGDLCDGNDSDLCEEGVYICSGAAKTCNDNSADTLDLCNGQDDDCNPATSDGADEAWFGTACDGNDADLCEDGSYQCISGGQQCVDDPGFGAELCNGVDDDCNPATPDGADETWLGTACDGNDADLCLEGVFECAFGSKTCSDTSGDNLELCNGNDDDCNPATLDGRDESWFGDSCDGPDTDLCEEGSYTCTDSVKTCTDATSNNVESCNGVDDDCNPATADGADATWLGTTCDGVDTDLCKEGEYICQDGNQTCNDTTADNVELCNGTDDDCNPATADGSQESWLNDVCDGPDDDLCEEGVYVCSGGSQTCTDTSTSSLELCDGLDNDCNPATPDGADASWLGTACDGADSDLCKEGSYICNNGSQTCNDTTGDTLDLCNGSDDDCNPATADGADASWLGDPCDGPDSDLCQEGGFICSGGSKTCGDNTGDSLDLCNGVDDDCNPATADGTDATWLGDPCDGPDTDLCQEGSFICDGGSKTCNDATGNTLDLCNGADDDCNPATADGADASWLGDTCDGSDTDLCHEGVYTCSGGSQSCSDTSGNNAEICNGVDDDCNPATADGTDASWLGDPCDGADSDLCKEGTYSCTNGNQSCSDTSGNDLELCNGNDDDCNPATADGADESWLGDACDGTDSDFCAEGNFYCSSGSKLCSDTSGNNVEICNGIDDDCDPSSADGADESWLGNSCDGPDSDLCTEGISVCSGGNQTCTDTTGNNLELCNGVNDDCNGATPDGSDESWYNTACDGPDSDLCMEGVNLCQSSHQVCTDSTGSTTETCNGSDDDCDGYTDEDDAGNPLTADCYTGPSGTEDVGICHGGMKTCSGGSYGSCVGQQTPQSTDAPDSSGIDSNCDGVDGVKATSIFVATPANGGSDSNSGAFGDPVATIAHAITLANSCSPKCDVLISSGTYTASVTLVAGVDLFGGYDPSTWARNLSIQTVIVGSTTRAVIANGLSSDTKLQGLTIRGKNYSSSGTATYALWVNNTLSERLLVDNCLIQAGNGGRGVDGSSGSTGATGSNGGNGSGGSGGSRGTVNCSPYGSANGGTGGGSWDCGSGGGGTGSAGTDTASGGGGGSAGSNKCSGCDDTGGNGGGGGAGYAGATGSRGSTSSDSDGYFSSGYWYGATSSSGYRGKNGTGGGGGGGGGTDIDPWYCVFWSGTQIGGGGGGGGAGGCGGLPGTGGGQGGGSFGIVLIGSTIRVTNTDIELGDGGNGGSGGAGGNGGVGKGGGAGYNPSGDEAGTGGGGNSGGDGGGAGGSAGGCGGPSIGTALVSSSSIATINVSYSGGSGGSGGAGGAGGRTGGDGSQATSGQTGCTGYKSNVRTY